MNSGIYTIFTIPVFAILYFYTAIGVLILIVLSWFNAKGPVRFLSRIWAKSVFFLMGKRLRIQGKENPGALNIIYNPDGNHFFSRK